MKNTSALAMRETAEVGSGSNWLSTAGRGIVGMIVFAFKYFGQLPL